MSVYQCESCRRLQVFYKNEGGRPSCSPLCFTCGAIQVSEAHDITIEDAVELIKNNEVPND